MFKCKSKYNRNSKQCSYVSHDVNDMGMHLRTHKEQFELMDRNARHTSNNHDVGANRHVNVNDIPPLPFNETEIVVEIISYSDDETMEDIIDARRKRYKRRVAARVAAQSNVPIDIVTISSDEEAN